MKLFTKISGFLFIFILIVIVIQHLICPVYDYPPEKIFFGDKFYNPYSDISSKKKVKANFHAHSRIWLGLTNGRDNYKEELVQRYKYLNYDIAGISDYQSINSYQQNDPLYIPEYEHGFGFTKNHQICIGTNKVLWNDYLLLQTTNNKQNIIKELKSRSELVVVAHPELRDAYDIEDMQKLTDYDCMEIINHNYGQAFKLWDAALSSGHCVFGLGADDSHSSANPHDMGCCFNVIYCDSITKTDVMNSLKAGRNITVNQDAETMELKRKKALELPQILSYDVVNDTIILKIDKLSKEVNFIGQNGSIRERVLDKNLIFYVIKPEDAYIRSSITFNDGTVFYLNPVFRSSSGKPENLSANINIKKTLILRLISGIILIFFVFIFIYFKKKKRVIKPPYAKHP